jgi:hypothetical protein
MTPDIANAARAILRQYNEADYRESAFHGPHFVTYFQGTFLMRPCGAYSHHRYSFLVTPDYDFGRLEEPFWIFNVL